MVNWVKLAKSRKIDSREPPSMSKKKVQKTQTQTSVSSSPSSKLFSSFSNLKPYSHTTSLPPPRTNAIFSLPPPLVLSHSPTPFGIGGSSYKVAIQNCLLKQAAYFTSSDVFVVGLLAGVLLADLAPTIILAGEVESKDLRQ